MYMDTDSFIYHIKCKDLYGDIRKDMKNGFDLFDTSNYAPNNQFGIPLANNKVVGKMKDECCGRIPTEIVAVRSKMYALRVEYEDFLKKAKGITNNVVSRTITFQDYLDCLQNFSTLNRTQCLITSHLHKVETVKQKKIALSPFDDKRYLQQNTTDTLAWGHYKIISNNINVLDDDDVEMIDLSE